MTDVPLRLTPRQRRFIEEYLVDLNAGAATIRAGYSPTGCYVQGCRLLRNPKIRQAIDAEIARQSERTGMQSDAILHHLGQIAFSDIGGAFDDNGTLLPLHEMPESMQLTIADMDIRETGEKCVSKRIRLSDKNRALELLGKHLGLFAERSK